MVLAEANKKRPISNTTTTPGFSSNIILSSVCMNKALLMNVSCWCICVVQKDPLFQQFVIMVSLEGLENKYNLELSRGKCVCMHVRYLLWGTLWGQMLVSAM